MATARGLADTWYKHTSTVTGPWATPQAITIEILVDERKNIGIMHMPEVLATRSQNADILLVDPIPIRFRPEKDRHTPHGVFNGGELVPGTCTIQTDGLCKTQKYDADNRPGNIWSAGTCGMGELTHMYKLRDI